MLPLYLDQLDPERQGVFKKLKAFSPQFILAGGTAIMLQIGHRLSVDFDCFSPKPISKKVTRKIKKIFGEETTIQIATSDMNLVTIKRSIDIHFVFHPYQTLRKTINTDSIDLFHLDDLVANKAITIGRRATWRDYVDLFFFLKWQLFSLFQIISLAEQKFKGEFNSRLFLSQLTFFEDVDIASTTFLKESYTASQIQAYLEKEVENYLKKTLHL